MANKDYLVTIQQFGASNSTDPAISVQAPMPDSFMYDAQSTYDAPYAKGLTGDGMVTNILAAVGYRATMQVLTANLWTGSQESQLALELEFQTETDPLYDVRLPILNLLKLATPGVASTGVLTSPGPSLDLSARNVAQVVVDASTNVGKSLAAATGGNNVVSSFLSGAGAFVGASGAKLVNMFSDTTNAQSKVTTLSTTSPTDMVKGSYWTQKLKNNITIKIGSYMYFDSVVIQSVSQTFASNFDAQTGWPHHAKVAIQFKPTFMVTKDDLDRIFLNPGGQGSPNSSSVGLSLTGISNAVSSAGNSLLNAGANFMPGLAFAKQ